MSATILDGRHFARKVRDRIRAAVAAGVGRGQLAPTLVVVLVGADPASVQYAGQLQRTVTTAGMAFRLLTLPIEADDAALAAALAALNADETVNGILLQFPLPPHLSAVQAATLLAPAKDVDGVNPLNAGRLYLGQGEFLAPATPLGGIELLRLAGIPLAGRSVVVVGRSAIVGRPLAMLCLQRDATVTISHSRTPDLAGVTRQADVLAVAVGRPGLITAEMVRPGAVVLDFGTSVVDGRLVGDVSPDVATVAGALTPVPGGTGPMTSAMLIQNTLLAAERQGRFTP